jgi:subtilisin family serine protease
MAHNRWRGVGVFAKKWFGVMAVVALLLIAGDEAPRAGAPPFRRLPEVVLRRPAPFHIQTLAKARDLVHAMDASTDPNFLIGGLPRIDGTGLAVAVLDTGLNTDHVDFAGDGRIPARRNFSSGKPDDVDVTDRHGHGSNVAGIVVAHGKHSGVAPGGNIVPLKITNDDGDVETVEVVEQALRWVLDNHERFSISVVVTSIADDSNQTDDTSVNPTFAKIHCLIQALRAARVPVVAAAGNFYHEFNPADPAHPTAQQGMSAPAIFRETISVGAVYDDDYKKPFTYKDGSLARKTGPDFFTPFSQRLDESTEAKCRTDVFAPGAPIDSSGIGGPEAVDWQSGTSQAAPVVAGVILMVQQFHKQKVGKLPCVDDLEAWLHNSGQAITDGQNEDDNVVHTHKSFRRVDARGALQAANQNPCMH